MARLCIVSSGCLSSGPRVDKEASALCALGHDVTVIVTHALDWMPGWDARLAAGRAFQLRALDWLPHVRRRSLLAYTGAALERASKAALERYPGRSRMLAVSACSPMTLSLLALARLHPADLYIGHNLAALPVVAALAALRRVPFAFDAEDDHYAQYPEAERASVGARVADELLRAFLPRASYVTAASPAMADALAQRYSIARPTVLRNVFPFAERERSDGKQLDRKTNALSLYWFSQRIGLDRGLQDAIRAAKHLQPPFELHLRGHSTPESLRELRALAAAEGIAPFMHIHPQVHPSELLSRSMEHDIGLALEQPVNSNYLLTATNKLFFYMTAGLAVVATDTPGQREVLQAERPLFELYPAGDADALGAILARLQRDPTALARNKALALEAAKSRFDWANEQRALAPLVERALVQP